MSPAPQSNWATLAIGRGPSVTGGGQPSRFECNYRDIENGRIDFPPASFRLVTCDVWGCCRQPLELMRRIRAWLAPGGLLVGEFRNLRQRGVVADLLSGRWRSFETDGAGGDEVRFYTRREFEKLLYRAGFSIGLLEPIPNRELQAYRQGGQHGTINLGAITLRGLTAADTEEFHVEFYRVEAAPAPAVDYGLTSIVMLTHNGLSYTRQCLESIREYTDEPYETICVDNGSTDGTREYLSRLPDVRLIANVRNRGFSAGCNQGLGVARGRNLLLLNNDTIVTTGWLTRMLRALYAGKETGMAGPCSNHVAGAQCVPADYDDLNCLDGFAWEWAKQRDGLIEPVQELIGFCLLMKREVLESIGGLDERFGIGMFEDNDICRSARRAGYGMVIARDAFVHHFGSSTFRLNGIDSGALFAKNREIYHEKWAESNAQRTSKRFAIRASSERGLFLERRQLQLSLCMIARDNARTIDAALASAKPWVDEIVVVDTGSKDETPVIARAHGALVKHFPWCDDFAAARNESLRHASGKWIFWMDSDDTLPPECGRKLRENLQGIEDPSVLGLVMKVHCPNLAAGPEMTVVDHVKVIRNLPGLRFEGRIHEQVLPSIRKLNGEVAWLDSYVVHSGADRTPAGRQAKLERDLRLLKFDMAERPGHPFVLFNLGMTLVDAGDYAQAAAVLMECLHASQPSESHVRKAYALLVESLNGKGDPGAAQKTCWEGLGRFPGDPELLFRCGVLAMDRQSWPEAASAFEQILSSSRPRYFASVDAGILNYKAAANLAATYEQMDEWERAETLWRRSLEYEPAFRHAFEGLNRNLLKRNLSALAEREARARLSDPSLGSAPWTALALAQEQMGHIERAADSLARAVAQNPDDLTAWREYGRFLFERGPEQEAETCLRHILRLDPNDASAHHNLGQILLRRRRHGEAIACFVRALEIRPAYAATLRQLARAQEAEGDRQAAAATWLKLEAAPRDG